MLIDSYEDYEVIYDQLPSESGHNWRYIAFGPDNKLYVFNYDQQLILIGTLQSEHLATLVIEMIHSTPSLE
jgi:hypothetical protein